MFFHPLLATLITGAARLMLATTERLIKDVGLDWAFCDTDSMAIAKPHNMSQDEFYKKAKQVYEWFTPLNPYTEKTPLLKIEDDNYSLTNRKELEPLYCYAISSKRYALFNFDKDNNIKLRKVSAHGLGHLIAPYNNGKATLKGVQQWQQDFWLEIIKAEVKNKIPNFNKLQNFNIPAVSRYGATTPALLKWYDEYNKDKPYREQVKPFNFLLSMQGNLENKQLKPVATYQKDVTKAAKVAFDKNTGTIINKKCLRTYSESLAQYHLHPESKFMNGNFIDKGKTQRRHIIVETINYIGKEANKWEEQFFTGFNPNAQIEYGISIEQKKEMLQTVLNAISVYGLKCIAQKAKVSERYVSKIVKSETNVSDKILLKLYSAIQLLKKDNISKEELCHKVIKLMKDKNISIRSLAKELKIDSSNLAKILSGKRKSKDYLYQAYSYLTKANN